MIQHLAALIKNPGENQKEIQKEIIDGLDLNLDLDHEFDKIEENFLAKASRELRGSRGEYLKWSW